MLGCGSSGTNLLARVGGGACRRQAGPGQWAFPGAVQLGAQPGERVEG